MTARDRALSWFLDPTSPAAEAVPKTENAPADPFPPTAGPQIGSAVVLGRPGQAEPVAAAVALALSQGARPRVATVAVIAGESPGPNAPGPLTAAERCIAAAGTEIAASAAPWATPGGGRGEEEISASDRTCAPPRDGRGDTERPAGGTPAARRLAARLDAHGLPARPRGRLVWVRVASEHCQAAARRALLVGAPGVLAVTAPRNQEIEELLAEQDLLLVVTADSGGPLARIAGLAPGGPRVAVTRPLPRGPARTFALAGLAAPRSVRELLTNGAAQGVTATAAA